jgi:hypothetical protein
VANTFAAPPALGSTTPAAASVTTLNATGAVTSVGGQAAQSGTAIGVPVVVYTNIATGQTVTFAATTVFTTTAIGWYRIQGTLWPTTVSTTAWTVNLDVTSRNNGATAATAQLLQQVVLGTTFAPGNTNNAVYYLPSGATIQMSVVNVSGSNTSGVYSYAVTIERLG